MTLFTEGLDVLVVDDDCDTADSLATIFRLQGHRVRVEHNGINALAAAKENALDVVILDIGIPGLNGLKVASELKKLQVTKIPILIAVSGFTQNQVAPQAVEVDHYIVKPAEPEMLCGILRRLQETRA